MIVLDQNRDTGYQALAQYARNINLPQYVGSVTEVTKQAECRDRLQELPLDAFACPAERLFPVHTKAATWLSTLYLLHEGRKLMPAFAKQAADNLYEAAMYWGISADVDRLVSEYTAKEADDCSKLPNEKFACVWEAADGTTIRELPMRHEAEVNAAASWLEKHADDFQLRHRQHIATRILDAADGIGMSLANRVWLEKQAGLGTGDINTLLHQLRLREVSVKKAEWKEALRKLTDELVKHADVAFEQSALRDLAVTIDDVDRETGLHQRYKWADSAIRRPEEFVFELTHSQLEKEAQSQVRLVTGNIWPDAALSRLKRADLEKAFGSEFVDSVSDDFNIDHQKLAEVAETLPLPDAQLLESLFDKSASPLVKYDAAPRFTDAELAALLG